MTVTRTATRFLSIAAAATLVVATAMPAAALTDPNSSSKVAVKAAPANPALDNRKYCIKETFTGSNLPRKICKKRVDWIAQNGVDPVKK